MDYVFKNHLTGLFSHFMQFPGTALFKQIRKRTSLYFLSGLSLLSRPHSLFLFEPFQHKTRILFLLLAQTVSAKQGPLPGQVAVWIHRTVTPNPGLLHPESVMETSRSARALQSMSPIRTNSLFVRLHMGTIHRSNTSQE